MSGRDIAIVILVVLLVLILLGAITVPR